MILISFAAGYVIVNVAWNPLSDWFRSLLGSPRLPRQDDPGKEGPDACYRRVLGVGTDADAETIRLAYLQRLDKYDPARLRDLGPEFEELATRRTRTVLAALEYLTRPPSGKPGLWRTHRTTPERLV